MFSRDVIALEILECGAIALERSARTPLLDVRRSLAIVKSHFEKIALCERVRFLRAVSKIALALCDKIHRT